MGLRIVFCHVAFYRRYESQKGINERFKEEYPTNITNVTIVKALAGHLTPNTYIGVLPHNAIFSPITRTLATEADRFLRLYLPHTVDKNGGPTMGDSPK
jgi:hypothetical protein